MGEGRCPHCGRAIVITVGRSSAGKGGWQPVQSFEMAVPTAGVGAVMPDTVAPVHAERRGPARAASFESDVLVPAAQAGITGLVSLLPAGLVTASVGWDWYVALEIGGAVMTLSWLYLLDTHRKLLWLVERVTNKDVTGDGVTGEPQPAERREVSLVVKHDEGGKVRRRQFFELPEGVTPEMLREFAQRAPGMGLSQSVWTGRGNLFSRAQYERLMAMLGDAGIVVWVDPGNRAQGRRLTRAGKAALRWWAEGGE